MSKIKNNNICSEKLEKLLHCTISYIVHYNKTFWAYMNAVFFPQNYPSSISKIIWFLRLSALVNLETSVKRTLSTMLTMTLPLNPLPSAWLPGIVKSDRHFQTVQKVACPVGRSALPATLSVHFKNHLSIAPACIFRWTEIQMISVAPIKRWLTG